MGRETQGLLEVCLKNKNCKLQATSGPVIFEYCSSFSFKNKQTKKPQPGVYKTESAKPNQEGVSG